MSQARLRAIDPHHVRLTPSVFQRRIDVNRRYLMSLSNENLLRNFYVEAGLFNTLNRPECEHAGWETPTCQLRGHFLGHWLSAAARTFAATQDAEIKAKANHIVAELARCQQANGGEWVGSTPEKYLHWLAQGRRLWAPQYVHHKTAMGLLDMYALAGDTLALDVLCRWAQWFHRWTDDFSREQMNDILDEETGGMLEVWADLHAITGDKQHRDLVERYDRPRLFEPLLAGEDVLSNRHANTTIPEVLGAARAYEVLGDERWRRIAEAYWRCAVDEREAFCTGGQTDGEIWAPPGALGARLGDKNQEHCVVYNMMRLAETLYRWTGDTRYADYWERGLYNGVLAQQHPETGMAAYYLPLEAGAVKKWSTPTANFWCCNGTVVQANAGHALGVYHEDDDGLVITQFIPSKLSWRRGDIDVSVEISVDPQTQSVRAPDAVAFNIDVACAEETEFALKLRLPDWLTGPARIGLDDGVEDAPRDAERLHPIRRKWRRQRIHVELPKQLLAAPLPGAPHLVAFLDGPVVLAGLCDGAQTLVGDPRQPQTLLTPHHERQWNLWTGCYRPMANSGAPRFIPLHEVRDERYTVYFGVDSVTSSD